MATIDKKVRKVLKDLIENGVEVSDNHVILDVFYYNGGGVSPIVVVAVYDRLMDIWSARISPYFPVGDPKLDDQGSVQIYAAKNGHKVTETVANAMFPIVSSLKLPYKKP